MENKKFEKSKKHGTSVKMLAPVSGLTLQSGDDVLNSFVDKQNQRISVDVGDCRRRICLIQLLRSNTISSLLAYLIIICVFFCCYSVNISAMS